MMRKILSILLLLSANGVFAQDVDEDAIILNQEMQFLEETARATAAPTPLGEVAGVKSMSRRSAGESLERQYFNDSEDDVSTRAAGPKRRRTY